MRFFNTDGPCFSERHYMVPAAERLPDGRRLIDQGGYLVVHAPRQAGKTTTLRALAQELLTEGRYSVRAERYGDTLEDSVSASRSGLTAASS